jgi:hypothetical protein
LNATSASDEGDDALSADEYDGNTDGGDGGDGRALYHLSHTSLLVSLLSGNNKSIDLGCLKCKENFVVSSSPDGFSITLKLKCACAPKQGVDFKTSPVVTLPGGKYKTPEINIRLPWVAYAIGMTPTFLRNSFLMAGVNCIGKSQAYDRFDELEEPVRRRVEALQQQDAEDLYRKVRAVIDANPEELTIGKLWVPSPVLLPDPINPGQYTNKIVRLVIRTDGHGPKRSYTHGSDSTEFVTATFVSQPAVPDCEEPIILDLRYCSSYCGFCCKHFRKHGASVKVPSHKCVATSNDMAAQAESGALETTSSLLTTGWKNRAYFCVGVIIADGDFGSLPGKLNVYTYLYIMCILIYTYSYTHTNIHMTYS